LKRFHSGRLFIMFNFIVVALHNFTGFSVLESFSSMGCACISASALSACVSLHRVEPTAGWANTVLAESS
jgi:hypothetical protein